MVITEQSTLNQVRSLLTQAERDVVAVRHDPAKAEQVVRAVEQVEALLLALQAQRIDIRSEKVRADSLHGRLLREAKLVERQVLKSGRAGALAESALFGEVRAAVALRRKRTQFNLGIAVAAGVIVAVLLFVVLPRVFPATPTADTMAVAQLASAGNLANALARAQTEQAQAPNDEQIGLWIAALEQQLGKPEAAESWQQARARYSNEIDFLGDRSQVELALANPSAAEQTAEQLRALPDGMAIGTLQLGAVREQQGQNAEAIKLYTEAGQLAEQENKPELVVLARQRMASLIQMGP